MHVASPSWPSFGRWRLILDLGGQAFLPETMDKIRELAALREEKGLNFEIEVDGGIDDQTIAQAKEAGATVFVAGSYVFKGDVNERVQALRNQLD